jgi:DNA polymerase III epsilon subunit-like protein
MIFDASGAGKPKSYKAPVTDTFVWPRLVHLSWIILDTDLKPIKDFDFIVNPEGYSFDEDKIKNCHIDEEDIKKKGQKLEDILKAFSESLEETDFLWAHNLNMNEMIVGAEFIRAGIRHNLHNAASYCLMQESTFYCKLPGKRGGGYKWPTLSELHAILFKKRFAPAGNARADVIAATRCFKMLMMAGQLEDCFG